MNEINSTDYHDFVIKDGKLIGQFEQMYRKSSEIPWHQDKEAGSIYANIIMDLAKTKEPYSRILDIGCGLGYFTDRLRAFGGVVGIDVSPAAIEKAKELFPANEFAVVDIADKADSFPGENKGLFDLVILKEVMWYILPRIDLALDAIDAILKDGGYLICSNYFPPLENDFCGKDIIPSPERLRDIFIERKGYKPLYYSVMKRYEFHDEGPLVSVMFRKGKQG